jgi:hypothetical protein
LCSTTAPSKLISSSANSIRLAHFLTISGSTRCARASSLNMLRKVSAEFISMVLISKCQTSLLSNPSLSSSRSRSHTASLLSVAKTSPPPSTTLPSQTSSVQLKPSTRPSKTLATSWTTWTPTTNPTLLLPPCSLSHP